MPIFRVYPVADKAQSGTWQSNGSFFYSQIDDDPADEDVTYLQGGGDATQSRTIGFQMSTIGLPDGIVINSVSFLARAKRLDTGQNVSSYSLKLHLNLGPTRYQLVSSILNDPSPYANLSYTSAISPATGLAWKASEVVRLLPVFEVAQSFDNFPRVGAYGRFTQLYADINFAPPTWTQRRDPTGVIR